MKVIDPSSGHSKVIEKKLVKKGKSDINFLESEEEKINDINEDN